MPNLRILKEQRIDSIYSIPCNDCDYKYIGQTKRQFGTRLREHQKAVFFCEKENSALSEHTYLTNHTIEWDKSKIITSNFKKKLPPALASWREADLLFLLKRSYASIMPLFNLISITVVSYRGIAINLFPLNYKNYRIALRVFWPLLHMIPMRMISLLDQAGKNLISNEN